MASRWMDGQEAAMLRAYEPIDFFLIQASGPTLVVLPP